MLIYNWLAVPLLVLIYINCLLFSTANASNFKRYELDYGISAEIPNDWKILDKSVTTQLDNSSEAITSIDQSNNAILIAANCYTTYQKPSATFRVSIRTNPANQMTQQDLKYITRSELNEIVKFNIDSVKHKLAKSLQDYKYN